MSIVYTPHLKARLIERIFPKNYPETIYLSPDERYFDHLQKSYIAIKKLPYAGKIRKIAIAYIKEGNNVKILTIHPENDREIQNRIIVGRYTII